MAIWPFIFLKESELKNDQVLMNHERIHLRQQIELLLLPFYLFYLLNYLYNLLRYKKHFKAYKNIVFEREAYAKHHELDYLENRKFWAWAHYLFKIPVLKFNE